MKKSRTLHLYFGKRASHRETHLPYCCKRWRNASTAFLCHHGGEWRSAGAFSDGKYVISTEYGGWLTDFLPADTVIDYIEQADKILVSYGATTERFLPNNRLKKLCLQQDLHMSQAQLKHLGTDSNFETMRQLIHSLLDKVDVITDTEVTDVNKDTHELTIRAKARVRPSSALSGLSLRLAGQAAASSPPGARKTPSLWPTTRWISAYAWSCLP
ncbi:MAG: hypothetical protein ACLRVT_03965 [Oscillospiraceae bacterium]